MSLIVVLGHEGRILQEAEFDDNGTTGKYFPGGNRLHLRTAPVTGSCWVPGPTWTVSAAGSGGQCNTLHYIDSTMLSSASYLFCRVQSKPSQGNVPVDLTITRGFSLCFQCRGGLCFVLRRPIETTAFTRWDEKAGLQRDAIRSQCLTCSRHKKGDRR